MCHNDVIKKKIVIFIAKKVFKKTNCRQNSINNVVVVVVDKYIYIYKI